MDIVPIILCNTILMLVAVISPHSCQHSDSDKKIFSTYIGEIIQPYWLSAKWKKENCIFIDGEKAGSENKMFVLSQWNNDSLYFFFKVTDNDLRGYQTKQDHSLLYLDDMVEVLFDTRNDKDSCWAEDDIVYHVNLLGVKKDDRGSVGCVTNPAWNGNAGIKIQINGTLNDTVDIDLGYMVTLSFPWSELGHKPYTGLTIGIDFANGDNDGKGRQLFDWVDARPMRYSYAYGNLVLKKT